MHFDYKFAHLDQEDIERVHAMEKDLGRRYRREIVLIAYEKSKRAGGSKAADTEYDDEGMGGAKRGTTFGYTEAQVDGYPALVDLESKYDDYPDGLHRSVEEKRQG